MNDNIEITGGAGCEETAAIIAVIASIGAEERLAAAIRPRPIHKSQWVRKGQSMNHVAPMHPKEGDNAPASASRDE